LICSKEKCKHHAQNNLVKPKKTTTYHYNLEIAHLTIFFALHVSLRDILKVEKTDFREIAVICDHISEILNIFFVVLQYLGLFRPEPTETYF